MIGDVGAPEVLIILAIVVVLFSATRLADIGKGVGIGIREFRRELKEPEELHASTTTETIQSAQAASATPDSSKFPPALRH